MKSFLTFCFLLIAFFGVQAHEGGHHHDNTESEMRKWHHIDHSVVAEGSLLLARDGKAYIENLKGEISSIDISELSTVDREFISKRLKLIQQINVSGAVGHASDMQLSVKIAMAAILIIFSILFFYGARRKVFHPIVRSLFGSLAAFSLLLSAVACGSDDSPDPDDSTLGSAKAYAIAFLESSFSQFSNVSYVSSDDTYFYVESNGIPDHQMMVGITAWIERVPTPFKYTYSTNDNENMAWAFPLVPEYETEDNIAIIDELQRGAIAIAANGIPIFNPYNASGELSYQLGELDAYGGHSGNGDDYHYHYPPIHLNSTTGEYPIAFVFDGFPLYGTTEPDGSDVSDLDEFWGHEDADGLYHYHSSEAAPYMTPKLRGKVTVDQEGEKHNQIEPQPLASTVRGLDDVVLVGGTDSHEITGLEMNNTHDGYTLSYSTTTGGVNQMGTIEYNWNETEFVFTFTKDITQPDNSSSFTYSGNPGVIHEDAYGYGSSSDFTLTSEAVANGKLLDTYKCDQPDERSIPLAWSNAPEGAGSFAIVMYHYPNPDDANDPDKDPDGYLHVWDIDPEVTEIPWGEAGVSVGLIGRNNKKDNYDIGYTSPCSPDAGTHEYTIVIYALSETPASLPTVNSIDVYYGVLIDAIATVTVLGKAELTFDSVTE